MIKNTLKTVFLSIFCLIIGIVGSFYTVTLVTLPVNDELHVERVEFPSTDGSGVTGDISVHFLELGNKYTGDCTYIKSGDVDILIDAGSRSTSVSTISNYLNNYVTDNILEYVIVTHAHQDHYAGFATFANVNSIFDLFECKTIITFSTTNQKRSTQYSDSKITTYATTNAETNNLFNNFNRELNQEVANGATHYIASECLTKEFDIGNGGKIKILDNYYYSNKAESENDYSVCCLLTHGGRNFLFTGDLEATGEAYLIQRNQLPEVDLYKAGHHGSKTSSSVALMQVIKPKHICVCCCAGSPEYTDTNANQFPTQIFINNVAPYTEKIYVTTLCQDYDNDLFTSMNGNIVCMSTATNFTIECSNNNTILKETEWFKKNRTWPSG